MTDDEVVSPLSTPTANYGWAKPTVGGDGDAWGGMINADLDGIDSTVFGMLPKTGGTLTGALTPSQTAGIVGTTTNNNANAGAIGEVISSTPAATTTGLTSGTAANATSNSLTAGDWDVSANIWANPAGAATLTTVMFGGISTTSATLPVNAAGFANMPIPSGYTAGSAAGVSAGTIRLSLASTTTVYAIVLAYFSGGTCGSFAHLMARRRR